MNETDRKRIADLEAELDWCLSCDLETGDIERQIAQLNKGRRD